MAAATKKSRPDSSDCKLSSPARRRAGAGRVAAGVERDWQVIDDFPAQIPITADEIQAIETYLWPLIEAVLRERA